MNSALQSRQFRVMSSYSFARGLASAADFVCTLNPSSSSSLSSAAGYGRKGTQTKGNTRARSSTVNDWYDAGNDASPRCFLGKTRTPIRGEYRSPSPGRRRNSAEREETLHQQRSAGARSRVARAFGSRLTYRISTVPQIFLASGSIVGGVDRRRASCRFLSCVGGAAGNSDVRMRRFFGRRGSQPRGRRAPAHETAPDVSLLRRRLLLLLFLFPSSRPPWLLSACKRDSRGGAASSARRCRRLSRFC